MLYKEAEKTRISLMYAHWVYDFDPYESIADAHGIHAFDPLASIRLINWEEKCSVAYVGHHNQHFGTCIVFVFVDVLYVEEHPMHSSNKR